MRDEPLNPPRAQAITVRWVLVRVAIALVVFSPFAAASYALRFVASHPTMSGEGKSAAITATYFLMFAYALLMVLFIIAWAYRSPARGGGGRHDE